MLSIRHVSKTYANGVHALRGVSPISSNNLSPTGIAPGFGPFLVGLLVWGIGLSLGGPTGYAINPARDLGPRIVYAAFPIAGKNGAAWDYAAVPVVGPLIGAALAGIAVVALRI